MPRAESRKKADVKALAKAATQHDQSRIASLVLTINTQVSASETCEEM